MTMIFGAQSTQPASTRLTNGYDLYTWVLRKCNLPSFWLRSMTGADAITAEEYDFLKDKRCKVALLFDDLTELGVSSSDGTEDALRLILAAEQLGVPTHAGIALFARINDGWSVSHNWMMTFAALIHAHGYVPGFIGNTDSSQNCSFDRECGHFLHATADIEHYGAVFGAAEPKVDGEPSVWAPFCPSDLPRDQMALWLAGNAIACGDVSAAAVFGRDESILHYLW